MLDFTSRPFVAADAIAVSQVALEAWRFTYQAIYEEAVIASFVQTHYAPVHLAALVSQMQSGHMFFHVALHQEQVVGYCHLGFTPRGAELFRLLSEFAGLPRGADALGTLTPFSYRGAC